MLRKILGCLIIVVLLAGCNLSNEATTVITTPTQPPTPELPATAFTPEPTPVISALPVTDGNQDPNVCYVRPYGDGAPFGVLSSPETAQISPDVVGYVDADVYYPVVYMIDVWLQVVVNDHLTGWMRYGFGGLSGNCDAVPKDARRPTPPQNMCTLYFDKVMEGDMIFLEQTGDMVLNPLLPGIYYQVVARGQPNGWRVRLNDGSTGWIRVPDFELSVNKSLNGPCDGLPVEASTAPGG